MPEIAALLLAAGQSRRFGSDKLLAPLTLDGVTAPLILHSLRPWLAVWGRVTLVVAPQHDAVQAALAGWGGRVELVVAPDAGLGMGHSLAAGVAANRAAHGWLIGLADMPRLPEAAIRAVHSALEEGAPLAAPVWQGKRGHPVGFGASYREELLALQGDAGARHLLQRDAASLTELETANPGVLLDVDQPSDIENMLSDKRKMQ